MKKIYGVIIFWLIFLITCSGSYADEVAVNSITLSSPEEIEEAFALNNAIDELSNKVMKCAKESNKPEQCYCQYSQDKAQLKDIYTEIINKHPEWSGHVIFWQRDDGYSYNLSLDGLKRTFELQCP